MGELKSWINHPDNKLFVTQFIFVSIVIGLLVYLHQINIDNKYSELIIGIIGMFVGIASTAAKDLITGQSNSELNLLRNRINSLEQRLAESEKEKEIYKEIFNRINDRLVEQSGILFNQDKTLQDD